MDKMHPRSSDFRYRSANYHAVQSLESLVIRGVIKSWYYEPADKVFGLHAYWSDGPVMLSGKEVGTFEQGALAVILAVTKGGLTVGEVYKGVAGLKKQEG